jgi:hypothetical protein
LRYEALLPISRQEFATVMADGTTQERSEALLRLAVHEVDGEFVERVCLLLLDEHARDVRLSAVRALGHLARIHHGVGRDAVDRLSSLQDDVEMSGAVADALDDIATYSTL